MYIVSWFLSFRFIAEIGQRSRQLVKDLHMTCGQKKMKLNAVQSYLASVVTNMDHKLSFIKTALDQGSDLALLYSKRTLMKQLEALNNVKIHTPPIGTTIDIRFIYDINALINFVHKFGMLIAGGHPLNASAPAVSTIITTPTSTNPIVSSVSTSQLHVRNVKWFIHMF